MSKLGKVVTNSTYTKFYVVVYDVNDCLRGLELVQGVNNDDRYLKISKDDFKKLNYRGRKLDDCSVSLKESHYIHHPRFSNFKIRELATLKENSYCKLLKNYVNAQGSAFADASSYNVVRTEVHKQLIKMMTKGIYGV